MLAKFKNLKFLFCGNKFLTQKFCFSHHENQSVEHNRLSQEIYSNKLEFLGESSYKVIPIFQLMDQDGQLTISEKELDVKKETLIQILKTMMTVNIMDKLALNAVRQNRLSFYVTSFGETAAQVASAASLDNEDMVFTQYREPGVGLWRGFSVEDMMNQCFSNKDDLVKGKQMPIHYANKNINFFSISSPLGTQMPQAVGYAYINKIKNNGKCSICYFGEGTASVGDAHAALNFASTLDCPVIFFCRNNGYAITTPTVEQYRGDGIAVRGHGYGMMTIRIDGNDPLAVYVATKKARQMCITNCRPVLIESMSYRVGTHTSEEKIETYRSIEEIKYWKVHDDPISKFKIFLTSKGWWSDEEDLEFSDETHDKIISFIDRAASKSKGNPLILFEDVYDNLPPRLKKQMTQQYDFLKTHKENYPKSYDDVKEI